MANITLKERLKRIGDDLFDDESASEKNLADFDGKTGLVRKNKSPKKTSFYRSYSMLKQAFLFAPGAIFLWFTSWGFTEGFLTNSSIPWWAYFLFALSFFMVVAGLGDARRRRDYLIPLSSIFLGVTFGMMSSLFTDFLRMFVNLITLVGLFSLAPLIWIVPVTVKLWLDATEKEKISD